MACVDVLPVPSPVYVRAPDTETVQVLGSTAVTGNSEESVAVMVEGKVPVVVGVPVIVPVAGLIDRPGGSPVADQVIGPKPPTKGTCWFRGTPTPTWVRNPKSARLWQAGSVACPSTQTASQAAATRR